MRLAIIRLYEQVETLQARLDEMQQSFRLCADHQPDRWEGNGGCVICEGHALQERVRKLEAERDAL